MEVNIEAIKDGGETLQCPAEATSKVEVKQLETKKKRRRGKSKRKVLKPYVKIPWQDKRKYEKSKRNNRFRKIVLAKTQAPFNNNQFLMEIHKPEPENNFQILQTPSARTRDSSFSVDSEEEEEYLTKEFSSVYEDAQCERLSNMSKDDVIREYLLLEAKYDSLVKRSERMKPTKNNDDDKETVPDSEFLEASAATDGDRDGDEMEITDRDTSGTSTESGGTDNTIDIMQRLKDQDEQIIALQRENERLRTENANMQQIIALQRENARLRTENANMQQKSHESSEDSESDSSSTSISCSSSGSSRSTSPVPVQVNGEHQMNGHVDIDDVEGDEGVKETVNGFHNN